VQAHTLGEVGNLGTVSLMVSSGTIRPIFIEIGSYLTDKEQKISWHSFFWDTVYLFYSQIASAIDSVSVSQISYKHDHTDIPA